MTTTTYIATLNFSDNQWNEEAVIEDFGKATEAGENFFEFELEAVSEEDAITAVEQLAERNGREYTISYADVRAA